MPYNLKTMHLILLSTTRECLWYYAELHGSVDSASVDSISVDEKGARSSYFVLLCQTVLYARLVLNRRGAYDTAEGNLYCSVFC